MLQLPVCFFVLMAFTFCALASDLDKFNGVYTFVRLDSPDGPITTQKGLMIVQNGYLCHVRAGKEREKIPQEPKEEQIKKAAAAFNTANAACGTFTVEDNTVTATWHTPVDPNDEGKSSQFVFMQEEENLIISPAANTAFKFVYKKLR